MSTGITVIFAVFILAETVLIGYIIQKGREERADLEDRVMALSQPAALVTKNAVQEDVPGDVSYVDEQREWELSASNPDNNR